MALNRKIAYIDLDTETIAFEAIPREWRRKFVGGRGLDAYLLYTNTSGGCDPLGSDNVVVISAGLLGGTLASSASRTHIAAKSPLTNLFGSASMGGFFAPEMRWAGIDHFVIRGKANRPVYLFAHDGEVFRQHHQARAFVHRHTDQPFGFQQICPHVGSRGHLDAGYRCHR